MPGKHIGTDSGGTTGLSRPMNVGKLDSEKDNGGSGMGALLAGMWCTVIGLALFGASTAMAAEDGLRESIIGGYRARCVEVNTAKGLGKDAVGKLCDCEVRVFDRNYSTMAMFMLGVRVASGDRPSEAELAGIRRQIRACSE
jgi:hypothetical protein